MYCKKLLFSRSIVIVLLVLYSVDQALALSCYECESFKDGSCWKSVSTAPTKICGSMRSLALDSKANSVNASIQAAIAAGGHENGLATKTYLHYDCAKFVGTTVGNDYVLRMCAVAEIPCEAYIAEADKLGFRVNSCSRCDGNLCNSSGKINARIICLIISTILFFFQT